MDPTHPDSGAPAPRSTSDPLRDLRSLGEYRILRLLGEGGMGSVYLGYHAGLGRYIAIKVLADNMASNQAYIDRFYREARSGALLNHPNIVRGFAVGQDSATGKHYLVLEYVDGPSAQMLLERFGRLRVGDAVHIVRDIARALEHAHSRNIVHRDIKPDNILISGAGVAKLADLGLAKRIDEASHLTAHRQGFGTSYYMPYEQAMSAKSVDGRCDIYALGATLYHLLTGQVPFAGDNHLDVIEKKDRGEFTPARRLNPEVPRVLDRILAKMLARHPRDRYQTATDLLVDLDRSGLAARIPSFADPELARQDPWVQTCLNTNNQPTRPNLETIPAKESASNGDGDVWYLRLQEADGHWHLLKTTAREIRVRLDEGRIPATTEACRQPDGRFCSLTELAEFRDPGPNGSEQKATGKESR